MDAYDFSPQRIRYAQKKAEEAGYGETIHYHVANINEMDIQEEYYDLVFGEMSLHHFSPLKEILLKVLNSLKPDGIFIVKEYIRPNLLQWTDKQLEAANALLLLLPKRYRIKYKSRFLKAGVFRPSRLRVRMFDPSEAIESSHILPLLNEIFDIVEINGYGGTILQPFFLDIAHNFIPDVPLAEMFLSLCFTVEDILMESKEISSDFVLSVCKKRGRKR